MAILFYRRPLKNGNNGTPVTPNLANLPERQTLNQLTATKTHQNRNFDDNLYP